MTAILGRPAADIPGKNLCDLMHDGDNPADLSCLDEVRRTMRRVSFVHEKGGRSYGVRMDPLVGDSGQLMGAIVIMSDITERLQTNDTIKEAGDNLQALINASPAAILSLNREGRVISWNHAAEIVFGWRSEEAIGGPNPIVPPESLDEFEEFRRRIMEGETLTGMEVRRRRKDGSPVEITFSAAPLRNARGEITGIISIIMDVTELKRSEEIVRQRDDEVRQLMKMEAIGRLAGGMAHNLNNILTSVMGYGDLLLTRLGEDQVLGGYARAVVQSAERAASLCQQLLTFSRRQVFIMEPLDLNDVLASTRQLLAPLIGEDVELTVVPRPGLWTVLGNSSQLQQVLVNMALNSRAAMPEGGKLVIEVSNIELDQQYVKRHPGTSPGEFVMAAVSDTGHGMTAEVKSHLFEPFFTTREAGNGLGLSTAYGMVSQMGGHIAVYSEPGQGTTFKVYLPRTTQVALVREQTREPDLKSFGGTETVLVVEDRPELQHLIAEVLGNLGYNLLSARNGVEALRLVKDYGDPIDLVLTDLVMPHMGGLELAGLLRHIRPDLRVVFMSGYTDTILRQKGNLPEGYPFLPKPFTPDALGRIIRRTLDAFSRG
jgi:two-component system cell cycle sensor histidine kinase/response regulator CckA